MALTSNETSWATTMVTLVISMAFGSFLTYITVKAQHAKNIGEVQEAVKNIIARLVLWLSNIGAVVLLVREVISSEPVSRKSVFIMVWTGCILVTTFLFSIIMRVMKVLLKSTELHGASIEMTGKLSEMVRNIVESLPCTKSSISGEQPPIQRKKTLKSKDRKQIARKNIEMEVT